MIHSYGQRIISYIPTRWVAFMLKSYVSFYSQYTKFKTQAHRTYTAICESFEEEQYLFFGDSAPVTYKKRTVHSIPLKHASWIYTYPSNFLKDKPFHFIHNRKKIDFGILSASVKIDGVTHDISSWLETLTIESFAKELPSWPTVIRCWILHSGVSIESPTVTIEYINTDGEDGSVEIDLGANAVTGLK